MNRRLYVGILSLALSSVACASPIDEPLPDAYSSDGTEVPTGRPVEERQTITGSTAATPGALELHAGGAVVDTDVAASRLRDPAGEPTWTDVLTCITCAASRYKMLSPAQ